MALVSRIFPVGISLALILVLVWRAPQAAKSQEYAPVSRAEAVSLILRYDTSTPSVQAIQSFSDISDEHWYAADMERAAALGMITPDALGRLFPDRPVHRGEYLKMLTHGLRIATDRPHAYLDVDETMWIDRYAGLAATYKLFFDEKRPRRLHPHLLVTHQEAAESLGTILRYRPELRRHSAAFAERERPPLVDALNAVGETISQTVQTIFDATVRLSPEKANDVLSLVNTERSGRGLPTLRMNDSLQRAAELHAVDMWNRGYFSHFTPEGTSYVDRIRSAGYLDVNPVLCGCSVGSVGSAGVQQQVSPHAVTYTSDLCDCRPIIALGENLARGQATSPETVQDWLSSPGHRDTMLHPEFTEAGIAVFGRLWVMTFGTFNIGQ